MGLYKIRFTQNIMNYMKKLSQILVLAMLAAFLSPTVAHAGPECSKHNSASENTKKKCETGCKKAGCSKKKSKKDCDKCKKCDKSESSKCKDSKKACDKKKKKAAASE